jgi:hypothetical protein
MPKPTFLIIGAQKCGTDALYHALQQHPDIAMSPNKEPFFFLMDGRLPDYRLPGPRYVNRLVYDWDVYLQLFAGSDGKRAIGEASAIYLSSYFPEKTAARIRERIPDAKLIALVRQPAERAYSAYNFYRARDFEPLASFADALAAEPARFQANDTPDFRYRMNGFYFANLKPYYDCFPREQIRVYLFEEWNADPAGTLRSILRFLDVDESVPIGVERRNVTYRYGSQRLHRFLARPGRFGKRLHRFLPAGVRSQLDRWNQQQPTPMPSQIWRELTEGYREDIHHLQALIGRDLSHWLKEDRPGAPADTGTATVLPKTTE